MKTYLTYQVWNYTAGVNLSQIFEILFQVNLFVDYLKQISMIYQFIR
jgi:hypothetical protein